MPLKEDDKKAALETLPILDSLPDEKVEVGRENSYNTCVILHRVIKQFQL